jgi:hypothetical protein
MLDYLKVFPDFEIMLRRYTDEERGRLFMAMMAYAYRGEEPDFEESAREWLIWDTIKLKIDQCTETLESKRANGRKGGSTAKQDKANRSNAKQTEANESESKQNPHIQEQEQEHVQEQEQEYVVRSNPQTPFDLTDDELREIRQERAEVETAARRVGLPTSTLADQDCMDSLRAEHGADNLLKAIGKLQGAPEKSRNWRYVGGILRREKAAGYSWRDKPPENTARESPQALTNNPFALQSLGLRGDECE